MKDAFIKKASFFIGSSKYERIGQFIFADFLFHRNIMNIILDKPNLSIPKNLAYIESRFEVLYREFDYDTNNIRVIAISSLFDLVDRDSQIPYYDIFIRTNQNMDIVHMNASIERSYINRYLDIHLIKDYERQNEKIETPDKG